MPDVDRSVMQPAHPEPTDIYDFLMGEGFVMVAAKQAPPREPMASVRDHVRTLEGLLL